MDRRVGPRVFAGPECQPWVEKAVVPLVGEYAHLAPTWCHEIEIWYDVKAEKDLVFVLQVTSEIACRRATFLVGAEWFENDERYQRRVVVHEIMHMYSAAQHDLNCHLIEQLAEEDTVLRKTLEWQETEAYESGTEDMAELVCFLIGIE